MTMGWIAAGTAIVGAVAGADASRHAANVQSDAANAASNNTLNATQQTNAMQQGFYNQGQYNESPFLQSGQMANAALTAGLGLGNPYASGPSYSTGVNNTPNMSFGNITPSMSSANGLTALGSPGAAPAASAGALNPIGSIIGAGGAPAGSFMNAQGQTVDASGKPISTGGVVNYGATAGQLAGAANQYAGANGQGVFTQQYSPSTMNLDPSMGFVLGQGNKALTAAQKANGQIGSSQGMQDLINYNQNAASQFYQQGFNNFLTNQNTQYNRLAGLAQSGQNTATNTATQGLQAGSNIANTTMAGVGSSNNYLTSGAAANAAGAVGQANAITGGINNGLNAYMGNQYLNRFGQTAPQAQSSTPFPGYDTGSAVNPNYGHEGGLFIPG